MRHSKIFVVTVAVVSMLTTAVALAQQPTHQHEAARHAQHMEMCRHMMGQSGIMGGGMAPGMMGGGMVGMPMTMLSMRGEMMKAMGDIMMKYAQRAQSVK